MGTAAENPPMIDRRRSTTPPTCPTARSIEAVAPGAAMTMTCAYWSEPRETAKVLGAPTATASPRIGAIVHIRRHPAVPRRRPVLPRVLTSGSFLDLARAMPSIGRPTYRVVSAHWPTAASTFRGQIAVGNRGVIPLGRGKPKGLPKREGAGEFLGRLLNRTFDPSGGTPSTCANGLSGSPRTIGGGCGIWARSWARAKVWRAEKPWR